MKNEKHKRAFLIWLAIYPLITILFYLLGEFIQEFPIPLKTFCLTIIAVPMVVYVILPFYHRIFKSWFK
jgi:antibiotic biosynthesis monooxygenase (ABM) superfamily enzyme